MDLGHPATLNDVAREAGVSLATASRVLNGSSRRVAEAYRERVEAAARSLGYSANLSAQATARGTSATLALLVADIADPYFSQIARGAARAADEQRLVMTIGVTDRDPTREERLVRTLRGLRPRGIILAASRGVGGESASSAEALREVEAGGGTVVALGRPLPGVAARTVGVDNHGGGSLLGSEMAAAGYRDALLVGGPEGLVTSDDRLVGFEEGFAGGGGSVSRIVRGDLNRDAAYAVMERALADGVEPGTLVVAATDVMAVGVSSAIRDAGRRVGDDIAVAGFGGLAAGRDSVPALTTVVAPLEDLGAAAVAAVLADEWPAAPDLLPMAPQIRASTPRR
ncbi:LacI family DNA-binding transcriptional regulator [Microbacterium indicum]|uniref:LacI family DNA-binding transcriptional regulator n=1 Tax=Microbacterium indicum TaxID=358100 RepID=UPI000490F8CF|nr:LacI family DNA-binding transcriptional regulator [Microbacterium indicum]